MVEVRDGHINKRKVGGRRMKRKRYKQKEGRGIGAQRGKQLWIEIVGWREGQVNKRKDGRAWRWRGTEGGMME